MCLSAISHDYRCASILGEIGARQRIAVSISVLDSSALANGRCDLPIEIEGIQFSGFPGRDFHDLRRLDFHGRVKWVRYRFQTFFLDTFDRIVPLEHESYVWLCVVNLLTSAAEALSQFEFDDARGMTRFARFVERYFGPEFRVPMHLDEPPGARNPRATSAAEHLYKYFRSGLAHSFCIEWGGLQHRQDGAPAYLFETPQGHAGQRALGIVPRELVADFKRAVESYFLALDGRQPQEPEVIQFNRRFEEVYLNKARPPLP
jgi:hypothetical protein